MTLRRVKWDVEIRWDLLREGLNQLLHPSHRALTVGRDDLWAFDQCANWLEEYIAQPHPQLGKDGEICPFARPAFVQDQITFLAYPQITEPKAGDLRRILEYEGLTRLSKIEPDNHSTNLTTVIVLFPGLSIADADMIQAAYLESREGLNRRGVMLGAFFPGSRQPAHHNPDFHVYQAPFPIYVLRPMGIHDILFVSTLEALREYQDRYGARYEAGAVRTSTGLPEEYRRTLEKFPELRV